MTKEEFKILWTSRYPESVPISHRFRHDYPDRWFRIHSLPKSKRYPDNDEEWEILLGRQNSIITDIFGDSSKILLLTGDYYFEECIELHPIEEANSIKRLPFIQLDSIDLSKLRPPERDNGIFRPIFCDSIWSQNQFDDVLRDIALDTVRVFFMSIDNDALIIPYDGGVDLILKDSQTRDSYKVKYRDWLSYRADGL